MQLVQFINSLIDFGAIADIITPLVDNLPFHFVLHPALVHFALLLPVVALLLHILGLASKNIAYRKAANLFFYLGVISILLASLSGRIAGPDVKPLLSQEGQALFTEHMNIGYALAVYFLFLALLKTISFAITHRLFRVFMAILLLAGVGGLFVQAEHGGELVYKYAAGVDTDNLADDDE